MAEQALFKGIAIVIDDEIKDDHSSIVKIMAEIRQDGGFFVALGELPQPEIDLENFAGAAFFIMDWQLHGAALGMEQELQGLAIPSGLKRQQINEKIEFLKRLSEHRHAPVFIFTADDTTEVKAALAKHPELYVADQPSHIFVMSKDEVLEKGVFNVLNRWANENPSALVLRTWEKEYQRAKNAVFSDFHSKSVHWPTLLWQTFAADSVPASDELGRLIGRLVSSRMMPLSVDLSEAANDVEAHWQGNEEEYRKALMAVLEGERFIRSAGLPPNAVATGDVFWRKGKYWINVRPECDCIARACDTDVMLYLLQGQRARKKDIDAIDPDRGTFPETDQQAAVFGMHNGHSAIFNFKELKLAPWSEWKEHRIGRLLPPFITRIQQRYTAYAQRPGLPRIPSAFVPKSAATTPTETEPEHKPS